MKFIDGDEVHERLDYPSLVAALEAHHHRDIDIVRSEVLEQPTPDGGTSHYLVLPSWQTGRAIGTKLVTVFPQNEHNGSGLPTVQALVLLFDGTNGKPMACIDGTALTLRKTAGDSALGTKFLANPAPERMLMVGAGALGPHMIMAHQALRPSIKHVSIWNRTASRAEALAANLAIDGVTIEATSDLEGAARSADLISCATMAIDPLIKGDWLKPGAHLDLVGSYQTDMHECDMTAMARGAVFTDSPWSAIRDCGEITTALAEGVITLDDILADNFTLARGEHPGRTSKDEITIYVNGGGGHLDLMVAQHLCGM